MTYHDPIDHPCRLLYTIGFGLVQPEHLAVELLAGHFWSATWRAACVGHWRAVGGSRFFYDPTSQCSSYKTFLTFLSMGINKQLTFIYFFTSVTWTKLQVVQRIFVHLCTAPHGSKKPVSHCRGAAGNWRIWRLCFHSRQTDRIFHKEQSQKLRFDECQFQCMQHRSIYYAYYAWQINIQRQSLTHVWCIPCPFFLNSSAPVDQFTVQNAMAKGSPPPSETLFVTGLPMDITQEFTQASYLDAPGKFGEDLTLW